MRVDITNQDDLYSEQIIREASQLLDIDTEFCGAVVDAVYVAAARLLKRQLDSNKTMSGGSVYARLYIPHLLHVGCTLCPNGQLKYRKVDLDPAFSRLIRRVVVHEDDNIEDKLKEKASMLVNDQYVKMIREVISDERHGFDVF